MVLRRAERGRERARGGDAAITSSDQPERWTSEQTAVGGVVVTHAKLRSTQQNVLDAINRAFSNHCGRSWSDAVMLWMNR